MASSLSHCVVLACCLIVTVHCQLDSDKPREEQLDAGHEDTVSESKQADPQANAAQAQLGAQAALLACEFTCPSGKIAESRVCCILGILCFNEIIMEFTFSLQSKASNKFYFLNNLQSPFEMCPCRYGLIHALVFLSVHAWGWIVISRGASESHATSVLPYINNPTVQIHRLQTASLLNM